MQSQISLPIFACSVRNPAGITLGQPDGNASFSRPSRLRKWTLGALAAVAVLVPISCVLGEAADPSLKPVTAADLESAFRNGLFVGVTEQAPSVLSQDPQAPVRGVLSVSFALLGDTDKANVYMAEALNAGEPKAKTRASVLEAIRLRNEGREEESMKVLRDIIDKDPDLPVTHLLLAEIANSKGDHQSVLRWTNEALKRSPDMSAAHLLQGTVYNSQGKTSRAMESLTKAANTDPRDLRSRMALAEIYSKLDRHDAAVAIYRHVLSERPDIPGQREKFALALLEAGETEEAVKEAAAVLEEQPESAVMQFCLAVAEARNNHMQSAQLRFEEILERNPNFTEATYMLGLCLAAQGHLKEAERILEQGLKHPEGKSTFAAALGVVSHFAGDRAAAKQRFEDALQGADPPIRNRLVFGMALVGLQEEDWLRAEINLAKSGDFIINFQPTVIKWKDIYENSDRESLAFTNFGALLLNEKMAAAASEAFQAAQEMNSRDVIAFLLGSNASARLKDYQGALDQLTVVLQLQPHYWPAHYAIGEVNLSAGIPDKAIESYRKVIELQPTSLAAYLRILSLLESRPDEAQTLCRELIRNVPASPVGYNELAMLLSDHDDRLEEALTLASKAVALAPGNGLFLDTLGWVHYRKGNIDQARENLQRAAEILPDNPGICYHLGLVLLEAGADELGIASLNRVLFLAPNSLEAEKAKALVQERVSKP